MDLFFFIRLEGGRDALPPALEMHLKGRIEL